MAKVLTVKVAGDYTYEIHLLNVGDMFPADFDPEKFNGFGGSRHPLIAGRDFASGEKQKKPTASMVVRCIGPMGIEDTERNIDDMHAWRFICRCINDPGMDATAELPAEFVEHFKAEG